VCHGSGFVDLALTVRFSLPPSAQVLVCSVSVSALVFPACGEGIFYSCFFVMHHGRCLLVIFPPVGFLPEVLVQIPFSEEDFVRTGFVPVKQFSRFSVPALRERPSHAAVWSLSSSLRAWSNLSSDPVRARFPSTRRRDFSFLAQAADFSLVFSPASSELSLPRFRFCAVLAGLQICVSYSRDKHDGRFCLLLSVQFSVRFLVLLPIAQHGCSSSPSFQFWDFSSQSSSVCPSCH
jgi:hypothetical protein